MRWSYKTVHFAMKKEGLLGSAFLDESEVELSLNEYGKAGWELVSMLETLDGLIAVFKQPLSLGSRSLPPQSEEIEDQYISLKSEKGKGESEARPTKSVEKRVVEDVDQEIVPIDDYEVIAEEPDDKETKGVSDSSIDVGSIRIE